MGGMYLWYVIPSYPVIKPLSIISYPSHQYQIIVSLFPTSHTPMNIHFHFHLPLFLFLSDCIQTKQHPYSIKLLNEMRLDMSPQIVLPGKLRAAIRALKARRLLLRHNLHFRRRRSHWNLRRPRLDQWLVVVGVRSQRTSLRW